MSLSDAVVNEVLQGIDDIRAELDLLREENDALQAKSLQKDGDIRRITEDVQAHAKREQAALAELSSFRKQVASLQLEQEESNAHISRLLGRISTLEVHIEFGGGNLPLYRPPEWAAPGLATPPSSVRSTPTKGLGHLPSPKMLLVVDGESEALNDDDDEWERDRLDMIAQREAMMNGRTSRLGHFSNDVFFSS
ncbi:hypothetical protein BV25DRAFT_1267630 [Artomyces pyxidatus]|uniref:Uncharacterized protein n=1 Tax=Artomyces pyxidatus TaxID=48021 RepID=A0ACB8TEY5_9AGAM|nr:hypothetical protein BV25DRAFT_1267630 [Artomyces pyxidatus]